MTSQSFAFGHASDELIQIACPGIKAIALTGRELRRSKARKTVAKTVLTEAKSNGFGG